MIGRSAIQHRLPTQEGLLLDYVHRLEKHRKGRRAVHVHLSGLMPNNRREHHVRIAANTFDNLVKKLQGQIFVLSNVDLMFIFKDAVLDEVEAAIVKLRFLFSDDPLLTDETSSRPGAFASWYVLDREYDKLLALAQSLAQEEQEKRAVEIAKQTQTAGQPRQPSGEQFTPLMLARTEEALAQADLANLMRRQAVSAVVGRAPPQPVFNEIFVSINDLRQTVLPKVNLNASPWLFQHLTETLDRRVLSLLNKHDDRTLAGDISINLNVATLLSPEFLVFDDNIRAGMRGTIVLELQKIDIFADLGAYLFARDFAHDRGYRICIDGLSYQTLPFVDRERLGADLVKVIWEQDMADPTRAAAFGAAIKRCGPSRVILCRCDTRQAVDFGQSHGITLFQGRFIEAIINDEAKRRGGNAGRRR